MNFSSNNFFPPLLGIVLFAFFLPVPCLAQKNADEQGFAQSLMNEKDYFRAISQYKRLLFFSGDDGLDASYTYQIALAYLKSSHFSLSLLYLDRLLLLPEISSEYRVKANRLYGINFYCLNEPSIAKDYFLKSQGDDSSGFSDLYLGMLAADRSDWEAASSIFESAGLKYAGNGAGVLAQGLATDIVKGQTLESRNPFVAGLFSTIIPGAGQAYTGHWFDAFMAFSTVGLLGFTTYIAFSYESELNNGYYIYTIIGAAITCFFHLSNIIGAAQTANYYTQRQKQDFLNSIRQKVFDSVN